MNRFIILLLVSFQTFGSEYLVYSNKESFDKVKKELKMNGNIYFVKEVFSFKEKEFLKSTSVNPYVLKIKSNHNLDIFINSIKFKYNITIEKNYHYKHFSDPYLRYQWGVKNDGSELNEWLTDIDLLTTSGKAFEDINLEGLEETNKKIIIAVIDSGIDVNHPDLKENILFKENECQNLEKYNKCLNTQSDKDSCHQKYANLDHDQNGYPLDCHGWNFAGKINKITSLQGDQKVFDNVGHGTHVAGIIAAVKNNIGVQGVIQNAKILPIQVSGSNRQVDLVPGETTTDIFAKGLLYAIKSNAQVINLSVGWSSNEDSILMRQMIELANNKKIIIVAAGGNSHHAGITYPCSYDEVICVGAHSVDGMLSSFSNFGPSIDIVAPGTKILSTYPMHKRPRGFTQDIGYEYLSGTSQAAPFVTGAVAKLLNLGHSVNDVRVKLLSSTRGKQLKFIRHSNLDILKAHKSEVKSFLYPLNKHPLLIKWVKGEPRSFKLKVKNYGKEVKDVFFNISAIRGKTQKSIRIINSKINEAVWKQEEIKEYRINFTSDDDIESDIYFKLSIKSSDEEKSYILQTQALTIITPEYNERNSQSVKVENSDFVKNSTIKPFEIFDGSTLVDFISIKERNAKTHISLIKASNSKYVAYKPLVLPIKNPIFLKFSKVDLDLDSKSEYVLTLLEYNANTKKRITKFFILDHNFRPYRYFISPKNDFNNELSVIPGSFIWLRHNKKMVPSWIGFGKRPLTQRESATPWQDAPKEYAKFHMYMLTSDGIKTNELNENESQFVSFLYQSSKEKSQGTVKLIKTNGFGFFKTFEIYQFNEKLIKLGDLNIDRYHDLLAQKPLPINSKADFSNAFFFTPSIDGAQNITSIWIDQDKVFSHSFKLQSFLKTDPIAFVLSSSEKGYIFQTKHHLAFYDNESMLTTKIESKVNAKRIRHKILKHHNALYLANEFTPGIASEVISTKNVDNSKVIYRSSLWRMLGAKGCESLGPISENNIDKLIFYCSTDSQIIKIFY